MLRSKFILLKQLRLLALMLVLFGATPNYAQNRNFFLPVELGQGIIFINGTDPYTFSTQLHPTFGFGGESRIIRIGGSLAIAYTNPKWTFAWGGRVSLNVIKLVRKGNHGEPNIRWGAIRLAGKTLLKEGSFYRSSGGVLLEVGDGVFYLSPQLGYDNIHDKKYLELSLGTDLAVLFRILSNRSDDE